MLLDAIFNIGVEKLTDPSSLHQRDPHLDHERSDRGAAATNIVLEVLKIVQWTLVAGQACQLRQNAS